MVLQIGTCSTLLKMIRQISATYELLARSVPQFGLSEISPIHRIICGVMLLCKYLRVYVMLHTLNNDTEDTYVWGMSQKYNDWIKSNITVEGILSLMLSKYSPFLQTHLCLVLGSFHNYMLCWLPWMFHIDSDCSSFIVFFTLGYSHKLYGCRHGK